MRKILIRVYDANLKDKGKSSRHAPAKHGSNLLWALIDRSDGLTEYGNR